MYLRLTNCQQRLPSATSIVVRRPRLPVRPSEPSTAFTNLPHRHGTGHGVGSFLNVHEGPQGVGPRITYNDVALQAGHVISNEPGYYEDGKFGIRIENVQVVRSANTKWTFGGKGYLEFEHFTMVSVLHRLMLLSSRMILTERAGAHSDQADRRLAIGAERKAVDQRLPQRGARESLALARSRVQGRQGFAVAQAGVRGYLKPLPFRMGNTA